MTEEKDNVINLKEELFKYLAHWRWFILSVFVTLILSLSEIHTEKLQCCYKNFN